MLEKKFIGPFFALNWAEQLLLVGAMVFTLLLVILLILAFFDNDNPHQPQKRRWIPDALTAMTFFTFLGWTSVLAHIWIENVGKSILYALLPALAAAVFPHWILHLKRRRAKLPANLQFDFKDALTSTGEVLQYIPPNKEGGFGKVHLNLRKAPYELDAVSSGVELSKGMPVRVIDILDDHILVVEPLLGSPGLQEHSERVRY
jgi:hypothetical protein